VFCSDDRVDAILLETFPISSEAVEIIKLINVRLLLSHLESFPELWIRITMILGLGGQSIKAGSGFF